MTFRPDPAVRLAGLTRHFGDVRAVDGLEFDVASGELFGIVGPDGAGKTTTLRMLAGVLRPTAGDAELAGVSVARHPERVKRHIAYMSQRFGLYADLTVRENIDFYADLYDVPKGERPARLARLYRFSALRPFENRLAGQLSGGMQQKLGLSCALIHEPEIMLLDEPTSGVDPISRRDLWLIVHEMVARGTTVILSTAYMDEADRCDRVALLHDGRVIALDTPEALQRTLEGKVYRLSTSEPRRACFLIAEHPGVRHAALFGNTIHVSIDRWERDWPSVRSLLESRGVTIHSHNPSEPTMEDVFIDIVRAKESAHG